MVISDGLMFMCTAIAAIVTIFGAVSTIVLFTIDMSCYSKEEVLFTRILSIFALSIGITAMIIIITALTPAYVAIAEMHDDAEVMTGEIESVKYNKDLGMILTVNGQDLPFEFTNGTKEIDLYDDIYPYTHVKPETGGILEYTVVNYDGKEHARASGYTEK